MNNALYTYEIFTHFLPWIDGKWENTKRYRNVITKHLLTFFDALGDIAFVWVPRRAYFEMSHFTLKQFLTNWFALIYIYRYSYSYKKNHFLSRFVISKVFWVKTYNGKNSAETWFSASDDQNVPLNLMLN